MKKAYITLAVIALFMPVLFTGCGSDGSQGIQGIQGIEGPQGPQGPAATADVNPESCSICHNGVFARNGDAHQAIYNQYADVSTLTATIDDVTSVDNTAAGGGYNVTLTFTVKENGVGIDAAGFASLKQKTFYAVQYDNTTRRFSNSTSFSSSTATPTGTAGQFTVTKTGAAFAPELSNAEAYMYVAKNELDTEQYLKPGTHYHLYSDVSNVGKAYGNAGTYVSAANVAGCEKCHGKPYMKHGYRAGVVSGLSDFGGCKNCHYDDRNGGYQSWQLLVDNPARYAELHQLAKAAAASGDTGHDRVEENMTSAEKTQYAYKARLMNDVHMAHAMEFPYPQSMANCVTCHEGKLQTMVLTDANFEVETCRSCHPVTGPAGGTDRHRAPALQTIWANKGVASFHHIGLDCNGCHYSGNGVGALTFGQIHTGYDKHIYVNTGGTTYTKYSEIFTVTIDNASLGGNTLAIKFSAAESPDIAGRTVADILPSVYVALYGYDTKDFIGRKTATKVSGANGSWEYTADLTDWADEIAAGKGKRVEIAVLPMLADIVGQIDSHSNGETDDTVYALNAVSRTFDLGANAFVNNYYQGSNAIVDVAGGCNKCHEALATTFHSANRGGNITVCRMCHVPTSGGGHLEMQSRSIDSWVHAIHSFQPFDIGDIDFTDPVQVVEYDHHIEHSFPNFTILNCKACHVAGKFNVPDQTKSLPGVLSGSDTVEGRNISGVPSYVVGPASRACGSCHRVHAINEDNAAELAQLNSHTGIFGFLVEGGDVYVVMDAIMGML